MFKDLDSLGQEAVGRAAGRRSAESSAPRPSAQRGTPQELPISWSNIPIAELWWHPPAYVSNDIGNSIYRLIARI